MPESQTPTASIPQPSQASPVPPDGSQGFDAQGLDEVIQSSLQTVDRELASLEAALREEFDSDALTPGAADDDTTETPWQAAVQATEPEPGREDESTPAAEPVRNDLLTTAVPDAAAPKPHSAEALEPTDPAPTASADVTTASAAPNPPAQPSRSAALRGRLLQITSSTLRMTACLLGIIDLPFSRLGRPVKNAIGAAAIATTAIALFTWLAAPQLRHWTRPADRPPAPHTAVPTESPTDSPRHAQ